MKRRNPYPVDNIMQSNLHSFGMLMKERTFSSEDYRFGFNGKEKTDEINGEGNEMDFGSRIYDSRLGKWLSLDPLQAAFPFESHYCFVSNEPIIYKDKDGKKKIITTIYINDETGVTWTKREEHVGLMSKPIDVPSWIGDDHREYKWYDIYQTNVVHYKMNPDGNMKILKEEKGKETNGNTVKAQTWVNWEWVALTANGETEGGICFTIKDGGDDEFKIAVGDYTFENIAMVMAAFNAYGKELKLMSGENAPKNYKELTNLALEKVKRLIETGERVDVVIETIQEMTKEAQQKTAAEKAKVATGQKAVVYKSNGKFIGREGQPVSDSTKKKPAKPVKKTE